MRRRTGSWTCLLAALLHLAAPAARLLAEGGSAPAWAETARKVGENAGGWALATPFLVAGSQLALQAAGEDRLEVEDLVNRKVVGGLIGDFVTVGIVAHLVPLLPLGPVLGQAALMAAGFVGWEIGSGNLANADWAAIGVQVATATALKVTLAAMGLSGFPVAALTIAGTLTVALLLQHLREGMEADAEDRPQAASVAGAASPGTSRIDPGPLPPEGPFAAPRPAPDAYRHLVETLTDDQRDHFDEAYAAYLTKSSTPVAPAR